jgi:LysR family glycine cleavage system transcriptional activator
MHFGRSKLLRVTRASKAAEELSVTPAAVHHQVKPLELLLGVTLFARSGNNLTLTQAAVAALPTLESAFDLLSLATEKIRQHRSGGFRPDRIPSCSAD